MVKSPAAASRAARVASRGAEVEVIEAAERLFGLYGFEGTSLRQIAAEAGAANHAVVRYHFGDKASLLRAIYEYRLSALESRRGELLSDATAAGALGDPRRLLDALMRPLSELRDRHGRRSYAAFLLQQVGGIYGPSSNRRDVNALTPLTAHIVDLLQAATGALPERLYLRRLTAASTLYLAALVDLDRAPPILGGDPVGEDLVLKDALDTGMAVLQVAPAEAVRLAYEAQGYRT